jgi:hypothetical protein
MESLAVSSSDLKIRFPEFVSVHDELIIANIYEAQLQLHESFWKADYANAVGLFAAHLIILKTNEQLSTEMRAAMVRGSKYFPSVNSERGFLDLTSYGKQLIELRRTKAKAGFVL